MRCPYHLKNHRTNFCAGSFRHIALIEFLFIVALGLTVDAATAATSLSISPPSLTFGNEAVDTTSSPQVVTLNNTGSSAWKITSVAIAGACATDFVENNTYGTSVAAGGMCTIAILFAPSAIGNRTASLIITLNARASALLSIPLSGTGAHDVILSWTPSTTPDVMGYNVFRGTTSEAESRTPLNSLPIYGTTYADTNVTEGAKYFYVVTAIASDDVTESPDSNEASATVP